MTASPQKPDPAMCLTQQIDKICDSFEECWLFGEKPKIEQFLDQVDRAAQPALLAELLHVEFEYLLRAYHYPDLNDYYCRFQGHQTTIDQAWHQISDVIFDRPINSPRFPLTHRPLNIDAENLPTQASPAKIARAEDVTGTTPSPSEFRQALLQTGLLSEQELAQLDADGCLDSSALAQKIQALGKLTNYQLDVLLKEQNGPICLDRYVITDTLGSGGMGQVYKAVHSSMQRTVALKTLPNFALNSAEKIKRFQREARVAAKLAHANIVTVHDAGEADGIHFLVMEYIQGENLQNIVKQHGCLPIGVAVDYILQAATGLQHAHDNGIVHRDIKPANIIANSDGIVTVVDLGLAAIAAAQDEAQSNETTDEVCNSSVASAVANNSASFLTAAGGVLGTVSYMSPEQTLDSTHIDQRTDIYGLGATLHFLLTGIPLFAEGDPFQTMLAHRNKPAPPLPIEHPCAARLEQIYQRMVAKSPDARYQSMSELIQDLTTFQDVARVDSSALSMSQSYVDHVDSVVPDVVQSTSQSSTSDGPKRLRIVSLVGLIVALICVGIIVRYVATIGSDPRPEVSGKNEQTILEDRQDARVTQAIWAKRLNVPIRTENSIGIKLQFIPPGKFLLGSSAEQVAECAKYLEGGDYWLRRIYAEVPQREVQLTQPFYLSTFEITQNQYETVMGHNPSHFCATGDGTQLVHNLETKAFPVESVTFHDAVLFCKKLSILPAEKAAGRVYRLPTEAEWEYACRAGTSSFFPTGNQVSTRLANIDGKVDPFSDKMQKHGLGRPTVVGSYPPNEFGLHDMIGNVWEWCSDFNSDDYRDHKQSNPTSVFPTDTRITRGGSWNFMAHRCRSAYRGHNYPHKSVESTGFRVVCEFSGAMEFLPK